MYKADMKANYYPQTDLHVALMFLAYGDKDHIALVLDKADYFPYVKREIINVLGVPSWNESSRLRYSDYGKSITLISMANHNYEGGLRGVSDDIVYYVGGWNVDDVRHNPYCACDKPDEEIGYYHGVDGRLHMSVLCAECGKRIKGNASRDIADMMSYVKPKMDGQS